MRRVFCHRYLRLLLQRIDLGAIASAKPAKKRRIAFLAAYFCYNAAHMTWIIVGLGNPGEDYLGTRHNTGRMALEQFAKERAFSLWKADLKTKATVAKGAVGKILAALVLPDTFMNKSGSAVSRFVKNPKAAERMIVVYDDLDLPLGSLKVSFDRGSGGHKGLESIIRALKTKKFARVRIGISPASPAGKIKKPQGEAMVAEFILERFRQSELPELRSVFKKASAAISTIVEQGVAAAMNQFN